MDNEWIAGDAAMTSMGFTPRWSDTATSPGFTDKWTGYTPFDIAGQALNDQLAKEQAKNQWNADPSFQGGTGSTVGGDWAGVEQWSSDIQAASLKYGVPVNLIKSIMRVESNGDPNAVGADGVWGPMQVNSNAWGQGAWSSDPHANIDKGVAILKYNYDQYGSWDMAIKAYLGLAGEDMFGTDNNEYLAMVQRNWDYLNNASAGAGAGLGAGLGSPGGFGIGGIFPNGTVPEWGEFGVESDNGFYGYGTEYGLNGTQHTGVDVPMAVGTPFRAPASGVVTCAGTNSGPGYDGGGCSAFGDSIGGGVGRIELKLDNGVILIFGHSNTSSFRVGDRVSAGAILGTSGGMVSPHIHLEARIPDPSTPSGYRIVDPRTVIGNTGNWAAPGYSSASSPQSSTNYMLNFLTIPGYSWGR